MRATHNVKVQMIHLLQTDSSGVHDGAKTVRTPLFAGDAGRRHHQTPHRRLMFRGQLCHRVHVNLGNDQHVNRCNRVDVMKSEDVLAEFRRREGVSGIDEKKSRTT